MSFNVLAINPGSTSTKLAVYRGEELIFSEEVSHPLSQLNEFDTILDQLDFRRELVLRSLKGRDFTLNLLDAIVGRGGLLRPLSGGTYKVTAKMVQDLRLGVSGEHASNLGGLIAFELASKINRPAFIVDPVVVDELMEEARISGNKKFTRVSIFHALNQKAAARKVAERLDKNYTDCRFVIAHLGGGISVGAHSAGQVIDVNNALDGDGPFSPERSGSLPVASFLEAAYSGQYTKKELYQEIIGQGGVVSYLGTNDMRAVEKMIKAGNEEAKLVFSAMAYQVAKEIGALATVLKGKIDAIILTGGLAKSKKFTEEVEAAVSFIAPVMLEPGEDELEALNSGAQRVLAGEENAKEY